MKWEDLDGKGKGDKQKQPPPATDPATDKEKDEFWLKVHRMANGLPLEPVPGLDTSPPSPTQPPVASRAGGSINIPTYMEMYHRLKAVEARNAELCFKVQKLEEWKAEGERIASELFKDAGFGRPRKQSLLRRLFPGLDR